MSLKKKVHKTGKGWFCFVTAGAIKNLESALPADAPIEVQSAILQAKRSLKEALLAYH